MPGWTLVDAHPTRGRTLRRPLALLELSFLWDGLFNGTADSLQCFELRLLNGPRDARLFSEDNIVRAWLSTKRRYPLAGAAVRGADGGPLRVKAATDMATEGGDNDTGFVSAPHFVVNEHDLAVLRPHEIVFGRETGAEDVQRRITATLNGPRLLSEELPVQLYVFETSSERADALRLEILMSHIVTDGIANSTFVRCFLDTLARGEGPQPAQIRLEDRLAMAIPFVELEPIHLRSLSPARRRWRRAVGIVIFQLRMEKRQGGHTLPCRLTRSTPHVAARSGNIATSLTHAQTATVIANCRLHGIAFGNACLALAQVAMTRVLYRRYLRGEISEEEWAYRKRQPHISGGPINLRPYLDKEWLEKGGGGEFMLSLSFFFPQLPFMTLGASERHRRVLPDGAPPFSDLLTFDRFLHRAGLIKKQRAAFFNHPLFFEIVRATSLACIQPARFDALGWMKRAGTANTHDTDSDDEVLAVTDIPMIRAHGESSVGNMGLMFPSEYPLPPSHPLSPYASVPHPLKAGYVTPPPQAPPPFEADSAPKIGVETSKVHLRAHPAELYLSAVSSFGRLSMYVFYDGNVYEDAVVREWLDEVREAVLWYLGRTHRSRRSLQSLGGGGAGDGPTRHDEGVQAKL